MDWPANRVAQPLSDVEQLQWVEGALYRLLRDHIRERFMIDVGAHHGTTLAPFLLHGWKVVAFEPVAANSRRLAARFAGQPRLTIRSEAVSDRSGRRSMELALHPDGQLHDYYHSLETVAEDAWHRKGGRIEVPAVALDDLIAADELPTRVGFLKVDTEGHDLAVLRGSSRLECEVISVEFWNEAYPQSPSPSPAPTMLELLRRRGFEDYIAVTHYLDQTEVFYSTLAGSRPEAMGNLFLFHRSRAELYHRLLDDIDWHFVLDQSGRIDRLNRERREQQARIELLTANPFRAAVLGLARYLRRLTPARRRVARAGRGTV